MLFKIVGTVIYGLLALIIGIGVAYKMFKGESDLQSALWFLVFMLGIAAIWS